jgi:hypothetical protein
MTNGKRLNIAASVRQRLLNRIRETGDDPNLVWSRYATERFLYRLSVSEHAGEFILKGALLFLVWTGRTYRPTVDLDLLGSGDDSSERLAGLFRSVCDLDVEPDGMVFDAGTVVAVPIREGQEYQGQRIMLTAYLGKARIPIQVDVGFGDIITPQAEEVEYPTLLDFPAPRIRACTRETVVAEKFQAMVMLGIANSRMKDFYDVYLLAQKFEFDGDVLCRAFEATFKRRKTDIPTEPPLALTDEFGLDGLKSTQWKAFIRKSSLEDAPALTIIQSHLREFLLPIIVSCTARSGLAARWRPGGPWQA